MKKKLLLSMAVALTVCFGFSGRAKAQDPRLGPWPGNSVVYRPYSVPNYSVYSPYARGCNRAVVPTYGSFYGSYYGLGYPVYRGYYSNPITTGYGMGGFPPYGAYGLGGSGFSIWIGR